MCEKSLLETAVGLFSWSYGHRNEKWEKKKKERWRWEAGDVGVWIDDTWEEGEQI